ncbi:MAG: GNAT family protein [Candidatus Gribaldobacteria bacterium]|nr:GNAT family protein [Candidatus Gribaldobacteria bacterium]
MSSKGVYSHRLKIKFILRPFRKGDEISLQKNIDNKKIARNLATVPYPYTIKMAKEWVAKKLKENKNRQPIIIDFVIDINGEVAGAIGFHKIEQEHRAEIGYWLAEKYWGSGIMTEAIREASKFAFGKLKLKRIYAAVFPWNKASMRVLEKNGFKFEGILRKNTLKNGKLIDDHIFAKIKK